MNQMTTERDRLWMMRAMELATRGRGRTRPNPMVGAVVVDRRGGMVAEGFHARAGGPHAEAVALRKAGSLARGATLYVNLEPCCHTDKRTPPCTAAIIAAGISRVVVGMTDPNPKVSGRGIRTLRRAGIDVTTGVAARECTRLNAAFSKHIRTGVPLVTLKIAASLDGMIADSRGESQWITGPRARKEGHVLRAEADAIIVGTETTLRDDPSLTCRIRGGVDPIRVVLDRRNRLPLAAKVFSDGLAPTWLVTSPDISSRRRRALEQRDVKILEAPCSPDGVDLNGLMRLLGKEGILHVMIEGGARLAAAVLRERLADRLWWFVAPRLIGGDGRCAIAPLGLKTLGQTPVIDNPEHLQMGGDLLIRGDLRYPD